MIVFTDDKMLIPYIELKAKQKAIVCNLSSYTSGLLDLTPLITKVNIQRLTSIPPMQFIESIDFDMYYAGLLQNDPDMHESLIRLVLLSYEGKLVIVMTSRDQYRDAIMESLIKYIQQMYGHNCWIVEELEDVEYLNESGFTPDGLSLISRNFEEMNTIYANTRQSLLGNVSKEGENAPWEI